jgi:L-asparagine oxygenase
LSNPSKNQNSYLTNLALNRRSISMITTLAKSESKLFNLPESNRKKWGEVVELINFDNQDFSSLLSEVKDLAKKYLLLEMADAIAQINQPHGLTYLHLKGLPQDSRLSKIEGYLSKETKVSESVLLGIAGLVGEPFAYREQKQGQIIQDVIPQKGLENTQSNASSAKFGWHSDDAPFHRPYRAESIILYCLSNEGEAETMFAPIDEIIAALNPLDKKVLSQPRFRFRTPESFNLYGGKVLYTEPRPIITDGLAGAEISVATYNVQPADSQDDEAVMALWQLQGALRSPVAKSFVLQPGELLIISSTRGLHARGSIVGDRWLQRCYARKSLDDLRSATNSGEDCRVFSSEGLFLL